MVDRPSGASDGAPPVDPDELAEQVEKLANKLMREGNPAAETIEAARAAARRMLEDSEERTFDPATMDYSDPGVIRRTSSQTASDGATGAGGTMKNSDGE